MIKFILIIAFNILAILSHAQNTKIALGKYSGGGDWYANPSSLTNLIKFCNENNIAKINSEYASVDIGSSDIFSYPFVHITGHGNIIFKPNDITNLRNYLLAGGFLHVDDNYGLDPYFRREIKKVFPDNELVEIPFSHPIYHSAYNFPRGLPKIHEHNKKAPQGFGIFVDGRLVCFYSYECDLGDGWEDISVHKDSQENHIKALKMGANIISYIFSN